MYPRSFFIFALSFIIGIFYFYCNGLQQLLVAADSELVWTSLKEWRLLYVVAKCKQDSNVLTYPSFAGPKMYRFYVYSTKS